MEKGREPPAWYNDNPDLPSGCECYVAWFWELSTERQIGMSVGPIPMSQVRELSIRKGLDPENTRLVEYLMQILDGWYMEWVRESIANKKPTKTPPKPEQGFGGGRR